MARLATTRPGFRPAFASPYSLPARSDRRALARTIARSGRAVAIVTPSSCRSGSCTFAGDVVDGLPRDLGAFHLAVGAQPTPQLAHQLGLVVPALHVTLAGLSTVSCMAPSMGQSSDPPKDSADFDGT